MSGAGGPSGRDTFQKFHHRSGTLRDRLHNYTKRTLGAGGSVTEAVALPPRESCASWVALHVIDFYNDISTIWNVVSDDPFLQTFAPGQGFPSGVEYRWSDDAATTTNSNNKPISVSAPDYIERVLKWIADQINDRSKFPVDDDSSEEDGDNNSTTGSVTSSRAILSSPAFAALCGQIFRRMFRVFAITYSTFFRTLDALGMAPHLNTCFKHFMFFCTEFGLLPEREIEPVDVIVRPIRMEYFKSKGGGGGGGGG